MIGVLLRRYGWIFGVYLSLIGTSLVGMGSLARYMTSRMFSDFGSFPGGDMGMINGDIDNGFVNISSNNPVDIMATFFIVVGIILIISGVTLAIILKKRGNKKNAYN